MKFISNLFKPKINHSQLSTVKFFSYDIHNKIKDGETIINLYNNNDFLGHIKFRKNGQICSIDILEKYRNQGLAKFLLQNTEKELKKCNINEIWLVCSKDHYFWSNQKNYIYSYPLHKSVTGKGYKKLI